MIQMDYLKTLRTDIMIKDMKCIDCGTDIPSSTDHASDEPYMFVCNDCRDEIGNGKAYNNEDENGMSIGKGRLW